MAAPNPFIRQLAASRGVVDLKVKKRTYVAVCSDMTTA